MVMRVDASIHTVTVDERTHKEIGNFELGARGPHRTMSVCTTVPEVYKLSKSAYSMSPSIRSTTP